MPLRSLFSKRRKPGQVYLAAIGQKSRAPNCGALSSERVERVRLVPNPQLSA